MTERYALALVKTVSGGSVTLNVDSDYCDKHFYLKPGTIIIGQGKRAQVIGCDPEFLWFRVEGEHASLLTECKDDFKDFKVDTTNTNFCEKKDEPTFIYLPDQQIPSHILTDAEYEAFVITRANQHLEFAM